MRWPKRKKRDFYRDIFPNIVYIVICVSISALAMLLLIMTRPFVEECLQQVYTVEEDTNYAYWRGNTASS